MKHNFVLALATSSLAGCISPAALQSQSSMELCMQYLTLPSYNVNRAARAQELARRGENCSQYYGAANVQLQGEAAALNTLGAAAAASQAARPYTLSPTAPPPVNCTTYQSGPYGTITCR